MLASRLSAVDLFCGSGGLSAGFLSAGIDVTTAFDNWSLALATYRLNIDSDHVSSLDLSDVGKAVELISGIAPDIIAGGPPCQDFSSAGKRVEGTRANLTSSFGEIVAACRPPFFLMENVPMVRRSAVYEVMRAKLELLAGYTLSETVLDASLCGVPQARKRFFVFGSLKSKPAERFAQYCRERVANRRLTVREYLGSDIDVEFYYHHPRSYSRRSVYSVDEPSPTIRGVTRPVPPGNKGNHLDSAPPQSVRPLTSFERSRIQTFPASWKWQEGTRKSDVDVQIGNAIPVNLASFVASGIIYAASGIL